MSAISNDDLALWYEQPAEEWVEALPIGNGRLGAMVFGGVAHERLQLNDDTLWSGGPRDWDNPAARAVLPEVRQLLANGAYAEAEQRIRAMQGPYTQSYLPMADLRLDFAHAEAPSAYRRTLDLRTALTTTTYTIGGVSYTRTAFVSAPDQVLVLHVHADQPGQISLSATLDSVLRATAASEDEQLVLRGVAPAYAAPNYYPAEQPIVYADGAGMRFVVRLAAQVEGGRLRADGQRLYVEGADAVTLILSAATSFNGFAQNPATHGRDADALATAQLTAALAQSYDALLATHCAEYGALFKRVSLDLGESEAAALPTDQRIAAWNHHSDPQLVTLLFQYGRYLLISCSRPGSQAANLQGIWNQELRPPWSSNYTLNINTEMNYWPAEVTNLAECHTPLFDLIAGLSETGCRTAATNYGARGWVAHHNSDLWRQSAPAGEYGHGQPVWLSWPMGGAWLCLHLWEHFLFGGDLAFLRERAYPLMRGAAEFCLDWLIEDDEGWLFTSPATSPENLFVAPDGSEVGVSAGSTMDLAIIHALFGACIAASKALGSDEAFRQQLAAAQARLRPPQIGARGQLQEWLQDWPEVDPQHRHISHLFGLFPGSQITAEETPELFAAARRSLELRGDESTGWSMGWKVCAWARLGDGERAYGVLSSLMRLVQELGVSARGGGLYANLFCAHPPFQIDGNFGATAGIAEMLLQSHNGVIRLLPALPKAWPTGSVTGLRARGGLIVDIHWRDGRLVRARLQATRDGEVRVRAAVPLLLEGRPLSRLAYSVGNSYILVAESAN